MSASLNPLTLDEFLDWERSQQECYEFDCVAFANRVTPPCEVFGPDLKVITTGRVRYPDVSVVCAATDDGSDIIEPTVVCEIVSPSTALTDRGVKAIEYEAVSSIQAYLVLEQDRPQVTWAAEVVTGIGETLNVPEIGVGIPMSTIYGTT